jgi:hypothetical protein
MIAIKIRSSIILIIFLKLLKFVIRLIFTSNDNYSMLQKKQRYIVIFSNTINRIYFSTLNYFIIILINYYKRDSDLLEKKIK